MEYKKTKLYKELEKINKDILKLFKDHVEWIKYEKSVIYPFWKTTLAGEDETQEDFKKWYNSMLKELRSGGKKPTVKPQYDLEINSNVSTPMDFSQFSEPNPFMNK